VSPTRGPLLVHQVKLRRCQRPDGRGRKTNRQLVCLRLDASHRHQRRNVAGERMAARSEVLEIDRRTRGNSATGITVFRPKPEPALQPHAVQDDHETLPSRHRRRRGMEDVTGSVAAQLVLACDRRSSLIPDCFISRGPGRRKRLDRGRSDGVGEFGERDRHAVPSRCLGGELVVAAL